MGGAWLRRLEALVEWGIGWAERAWLWELSGLVIAVLGMLGLGPEGLGLPLKEAKGGSSPPLPLLQVTKILHAPPVLSNVAS